MKDDRINMRINEQVKQFLTSHAESINNDISGLINMLIAVYLNDNDFFKTRLNNELLKKGIDINKIIEAESKKKFQQLKRQETRQIRSLLNEIYRLHEALFKGVICNVSFDTLRQHIQDTYDLMKLYDRNEKEMVYISQLLTMREEELKHFIVINMDKRRIYEKIACNGVDMIEEIKNTPVKYKVNKNIKNVELLGEVRKK